MHFHTIVSISNTCMSFEWHPENPPNLTALWWSILVKVWPVNGPGFSPVVFGAAHTPARNSDRTEMHESEWTTRPCGNHHKILCTQYVH